MRPEKNILQVGQTKAVDEYEAAHPFWSQDMAPADLVKMLVGIEIQQEPQLVGPPIAVLEGRPSGWRWIDPGLCHD